MAAIPTPDARGILAAGSFRMLCPMGGRVLPAFAAVEEPRGANPEIFIIERLARGGEISDAEAADFIRDARRVAELEHPNVGRVREVAIRSEELLVACDFIAGEPLASALSAAPPATRAPLDVVLRVLVDALTGLGALHNLRDVKRQPLKLLHGELTPANIILGADGTARIVHVCRVRATAARAGYPGAAYLAPEVLLDDRSADARADVYSIGAILWEVLAGKRLFADASPHAIVAQLLSRKTPLAPTPPDATWAADSAGVASKALGADPQSRYISAATMTAEIRRIAGAKLATAGRVATFVKTAFGAEIAARRERILASSDDRVTAPPPKIPSGPPASGDEIDVVVDEPSGRPPPMPSPAAAVARPSSLVTPPPSPAAIRPPAPIPPPAPAPMKTVVGMPVAPPAVSAPPMTRVVSPFDAPPTRPMFPVSSPPAVVEPTPSSPAAIAPFAPRVEPSVEGQRTTTAFVAPPLPSSRPSPPPKGRRMVVGVVAFCMVILVIGGVRACVRSSGEGEPLAAATAALQPAFAKAMPTAIAAPSSTAAAEATPTVDATPTPTPTSTSTPTPTPTQTQTQTATQTATATANTAPYYPRLSPTVAAPATPSAHPTHPHGAYDPQGI